MNLDYTDAALRVTTLLRDGEYSNAFAMMDAQLRSSLKPKASSFWRQLEDTYGAFEGVGEFRTEEPEDAFGVAAIVLNEVKFIAATLIQQTVFSPDGQITGLQYKPGTLDS